jgi:bacillithiol biosynthesis deacetylase BshB1
LCLNKNKLDNKVDILAFAAHPDDIELSCSGTLMKQIAEGFKVAIVDLTEGELGSRGTVKTRYEEANLSTQIMGISYRENLQMSDGFFDLSKNNLLKVITAIRKYQPTIILANAPKDRHPDHGMAAQLVSKAHFLSGLLKIETFVDNKKQLHHRANQLYHYIQDDYLEPDFVVDITPYFNKKKESILAYSTQFYQAENSLEGPQTPISSVDFFNFLEARARDFGRIIQKTYAEGFISPRKIGVQLLTDLQ